MFREPLSDSVIFSSREEAEASLKAEYARHEVYGYTHEVIHVSEVTQQELDLTIRLIRQSVPRPVDTLFLAFWEGRAPIPMDPIMTAIYAVASGALQPDLAVEEIRRHYGIPVAVASPQSDLLNQEVDHEHPFYGKPVQVYAAVRVWMGIRASPSTASPCARRSTTRRPVWNGDSQVGRRSRPFDPGDFFGEQPSHWDIDFGLGKCVRLHQRFKFA